MLIQQGLLAIQDQQVLALQVVLVLTVILALVPKKIE
jgi:hypothetical protein